MTTRAGERAQETGEIACTRCHQILHVTRGHDVPVCPTCGSRIFEAQRHAPHGSRGG